jgi:DNA-binding response OmpR family regulator
MRVVIIEDDEGIGFSLRLALEDKGCDVQVYADPAAVPFETLEADVILVDYYMPKMDGEQVIRLLQENQGLANARILLMSASPNLAEEAQRLGVTYLAKPFDLDLLYQSIEIQ